jgi:DNA-binding transcriptional ArsR family regulator
MTKPSQITWDWGTAYDMFCSLRVLHEPGHYGLRPAWAAGVRSRLQVEHRAILEQVQSFIFMPRKWIFTLPAPKDGNTVLWYLGRLPAAERLGVLIKGCNLPQGVIDCLQAVQQHGEWDLEDQEKLREAYHAHPVSPRTKILTVMLDLFSNASDAGERYLAALNAYQQAFFSEEEARIRHFLEEAVFTGRKLASQLSIEALVETLSYGVRLGTEPTSGAWVFIPSYWISPLVSIDQSGDQRAFFTFGCRPPDVSLVPGEMVPEGLLRAFKSLGDPTRLRILRYLAQESISPAEISRRLRLRAPTVTHHLSVLRLAGLVTLTLGEKNERLYAARMEALDEVYQGLMGFLVSQVDDDDT